MRGAGPAAAIGGLVAILGCVLPWVRARDTRPELDLTKTAASSFGDWGFVATDSFPSSAAMVVLVAGLLTTVGAMARSWLLTVAASILALAIGGLWLGLAASAHKGVDLPWTDLRAGALLGIVGATLALAMGLSLRPPKVDEEEE